MDIYNKNIIASLLLNKKKENYKIIVLFQIIEKGPISR